MPGHKVARTERYLRQDILGYEYLGGQSGGHDIRDDNVIIVAVDFPLQRRESDGGVAQQRQWLLALDPLRSALRPSATYGYAGHILSQICSVGQITRTRDYKGKADWAPNHASTKIPLSG
jgi:hypothetical protein